MKLLQLPPLLLLPLLSLAGCDSSRRPEPELSPAWTNPPEQVLTFAELRAEFDQKQERLRRFMDQNQLQAVLITRADNYSWVTAGMDNSIIEHDNETGAVSLLFLGIGPQFVLTNGSEAARVMDGPLSAFGFVLEPYAWYEANPVNDVRGHRLAELVPKGKIAADTYFPNTMMMADEIKPLRYELTDSEVEKYRWLGREATAAVEQVCRSIQTGMSEYEIEALTAAALLSRGIEPTVLLIGTDERIEKYRHALPGPDTFDRYAMVNVCAKRWGLTVAVTRFAHLGQLPDELRDKVRACAEINARYEDFTRPGTRLDEIFQRMQQWYADSGYPGEWELHHQGGAIGYDNREFIIYPGIEGEVLEQQAFAWNPTITGAKVEDTIIATSDGPIVITRSDNWPVIEVELDGDVYPQPDVLIR